LWSVK